VTELLIVLWSVLSPVVLLAVGGGLGRLAERRHYRSLAERERQLLAPLTVTNLRALPSDLPVREASLVIGEVVVASDYAKQLAAAVRNLFGGEVRSLQRLMERGRREALLRAVDEARDRRADLLLNVRFATTTVTSLAAEVVCYGTAVRRA
jgi:uncharacterized protein YbjQ (UPF0145 family)